MTPIQFVTAIALLRKDGENGFILENDDAVNLVNELIDDARAILEENKTFEIGEPEWQMPLPLDKPEPLYDEDSLHNKENR